jgi:iron complex transport system ATP-binding protein
MTELTLDADHLGFPDRAVLESVRLSIAPGRLTALVGRNGVGKSTLLKGLAAIPPVTGGRVRIDGRDLGTWSRRQIARRIAYLPQGIEPAFSFSVEETVLMGRYPTLPVFGGEGPSDHARVDELLKTFDLGSLRTRPLGELSGGERQRVSLARTVASDASVLLLDEPTANLDPSHAVAAFDVLRQEAGAGRTVVAALHDLALVRRFCDRTVLLHRGRILREGPTREVLRPEHLRAAFDIPEQLMVNEECLWCGGRR